MLLRHWSLYESIQNSVYTVSKLDLSQNRGQDLLKKFLVMIGCPVDQAKQQFSYMDPFVKRKMYEKIPEVAEQLGLPEIVRNSFNIQYDSKTQLTSTDMAYAISSLLETPINAESEGDEKNNGLHSEPQTALDSETMDPMQLADQKI